MLEPSANYLRGFRWPILLAMLALLVIGVMAVRSAEQVDPDLEGYTAKQIQFAALALAGFLAVTLVHYQSIGRLSYFLFVATLACLAAVFFFPPVNGSFRWISVPGVSFKLQPSELAKLSFITSLAWYLRYRDSYRRLVGLIVPFVITLVPLVLILREPDLGTSMLLLPTLMVMLFMAGARLTHLLVILAMGLVLVFLPVPRGVDNQKFQRQMDYFDASSLGPVTFYSLHRPDTDSLAAWKNFPDVPVAYCRFQIGSGNVYDLQPLSVRVMKEEQYKYKRVMSWLRLDDPRKRKDSGYQQYWSMVILGSGQLTGLSRWNQQNAYVDILPEEQTDFIFSVIGGQWGFVGCVGVLVLYVIIFIFGADIAVSTDDPFGKLLAAGVLSLLAAQIFINIGMTMGLLPVTGMTLPMVSYGGSSLLINGMALGLLVNVGQRRPVSLAPKPFEYGPENQLATMRPGKR